MCGSLLAPKAPKPVKVNDEDIAKQEKERQLEASRKAEEAKRRRATGFGSLFSEETGQLGVSTKKL
jgi:hypothetical protein